MRPSPLIPLLLRSIREAHPELKIVEMSSEDLLGERRSSGAVYDTDDIYRYLLWRSWDEGRPVLVVIMLNPSTAGHDVDDKTIATLIARCVHFGYGGLLVINLFAFRATEPADMNATSDPVGPANDSIIDMLLELHPNELLCAWGANGTHRKRNEVIRCKIAMSGITPKAIRLTKDGEPEHPLYKSPSMPHEDWRIDGSRN